MYAKCVMQFFDKFDTENEILHFNLKRIFVFHNNKAWVDWNSMYLRSYSQLFTTFLKLSLRIHDRHTKDCRTHFWNLIFVPGLSKVIINHKMEKQISSSPTIPYTSYNKHSYWLCLGDTKKKKKKRYINTIFSHKRLYICQPYDKRKSHLARGMIK